MPRERPSARQLARLPVGYSQLGAFVVTWRWLLGQPPSLVRGGIRHWPAALAYPVTERHVCGRHSARAWVLLCVRMCPRICDDAHFSGEF